MNQDNKGKNYAILSLVFGIFGLILGCFAIGMGVWYSIAGIILGVISIRANAVRKWSSLSIAGIVCGCISLILGIAMIVFIVNTDATAVPTETAKNTAEEKISKESNNLPEATEELLRETETAESQSEKRILKVHFMNVGQQDAALISCDGHHMLIDAGNRSNEDFVENYLREQSVETLDYVVGTYPDTDHIGGLGNVLEKFDCKTVFIPEISNDKETLEDIVLAMEHKNLKNTYPVEGETYTLGGVTFTIAVRNDRDGLNLNDWSVGILIQNGNHRFLFTEDVKDSASDILNKGIDLSADVWKLGGHGSDEAITEDLLTAVNPAYAVISVGAENQNGCPGADTLSRLKNAGVQVFRTDEQGTVIAASDGTDITWNCSPSNTWKAGRTANSAEKHSDKSINDSGESPATDGKLKSNVASSSAADSKNENNVASSTVTDSKSAESKAENSAASNVSDKVAEDGAAKSTGTSNGKSSNNSNSNSSNSDSVGNSSDNAAEDSSSDVIVHITETGGKYHSAGCRYLNKSDIEISLSDAKARGYDSCSKCGPPQ